MFKIMGCFIIPAFFLVARIGNYGPVYSQNAGENGNTTVGVKTFASLAFRSSLFKHGPTTVKVKIMQRGIPETGKDIYQKYCMSCHQKNGSGVPSTYPALQKNSWINGDKKRLISVVLYGLNEEIEVDGQTYNGTMPAQDNMTDKQIALVLTYLRQNFGNKASAITPIEVKTIRKSKVAKRQKSSDNPI